MMRSSIIFIVLFMLSFSVFHDSFISLIEKNEHTEVVHNICDEASNTECAEFNEIHSMFHFMAIMIPYKECQIQLAKREAIPHILAQYTPPHKRTSYKPPSI